MVESSIIVEVTSGRGVKCCDTAFVCSMTATGAVTGADTMEVTGTMVELELEVSVLME